MTQGERLLVGRIAAAHGLKGEVKVMSYTEEPTAIASYGPLLVEGLGKALRIKSVRQANATLIVRFEGVEERTQAEALKGARLYVAREQLPALESDVYYQADLIGLEVITGEMMLGSVAQVVNFGGGDLLEVQRSGGSLLVPFAGAKVDRAQRRIEVQLPDGFLDGT